jgi:hypothetical protein
MAGEEESLSDCCGARERFPIRTIFAANETLNVGSLLWKMTMVLSPSVVLESFRAYTVGFKLISKQNKTMASLKHTLAPHPHQIPDL